MRAPFVLAAVLIAATASAAGPAPAPVPAPAPAPTPTPAPAPDAVAALQREALSSSHAFAFVRSLCDEVGPRMAGSPGDAAAVAWGERTMKELALADVHAEPVTVKRWERGDESAQIVGPVPLRLVVAALGGSGGTGARGVEADVVEVASLADLEKLAPDAARGKIVFLDAPTRRARDGSGYGEGARGRFRGPAMAQKLGAVALLLRSIGTDHDRLAHTGAMAFDDHPLPAAALSVPDAELLHRVLEERKTARVRLVLGAHMSGDARSANVIGEVTGRERPKEVVLVGAHLDSWDLGQGAIDDGAGVGIALETARLIAALPTRPRRTLRVVLFANEEHGLDGARAYAKVHEQEASEHVVAMEADFGADAVYAVRWLGDPATRDRFVALARLLGPLGVERDDAPAGGGADVSPLRELGVPMLDLRQDGSRYFDFHHTANDTLDKIDPGVYASAAAAFATAAWAAADMEGDFGRTPESSRKNKDW
jgi:carboxypeptidase Q